MDGDRISAWTIPLDQATFSKMYPKGHAIFQDGYHSLCFGDEFGRGITVYLEDTGIQRVLHVELRPSIGIRSLEIHTIDLLVGIFLLLLVTLGLILLLLWVYNYL